jgi:hypothetical protein
MTAGSRNVPSPEANDPKLWESIWEWLLLPAGGGLVVAARKLLKRREPDFDAMAAAWFAEKDRADTQHRDAITDAIRELCQVTREEHEKTREQLRSVNESTRDRISDLLMKLMMK